MSKKYVLIASLLVVLTAFAAAPAMAATPKNGIKFANVGWFRAGSVHTYQKIALAVNHILNHNVVGTTSAVSGNTVTLTDKNNIVYTVDATNAKIMKAGAVISVSEIQVGDTLMVNGTISGTNVVAKNILDGIPQVKLNHENNGNLVIGNVTSVSGNSFVVQIKARKGQTAAVTVNTDSNTTFKKDGQAASLSDLASGQKVMVKGTKDATSGVVTATSVNIVTKAPAKTKISAKKISAKIYGKKLLRKK